MAATAAGNALTAAARAQQLAIRAGSVENLIKLWRVVDITDLAGTIDDFAHAASIIVGQGYSLSAAASSQYYGLFRTLELGQATYPVLAPAPAAAEVAGQLRGAALTGIINARKAGMDVVKAGDNGLVKMLGTAARIVLGGGRMTIVNATRADPKALGFARITSGSPCAFCAMISSRGPVYKSARAADFETHDHCACTSEPIYDNHAQSGVFAAQADAHLDDYHAAQEWAGQTGTLSSGTSNNALNNLRRWIAAGKPTPGDGGQPTEESG